MAKIVKAHVGCKSCGSSDALCEYEGGSTYCFSCKKYSPSVTDLLSGKNNSEFRPPEEDVSRYGRGDKMFTLIEQSDSGPIKSRKISQEVTSFFGVRISYDENRNDIKHAYPYEVDR